MSALVWELEWSRAANRRRLLYLNVAVPLLLVAPIALGQAPIQHAAVAYSTLFVFFGTFGSAIPAVRDGSSGLLGRLMLTGAPPGGITLQRTAANAALDLLQLLPSVLFIGVLRGASAGSVFLTVLVVGLSLGIANLIGIWIAAISRSIAEAALFGSVVALLMLHASGVFRTPRAGSIGWAVEVASPYRALHHFVLSLTGGPDVAAPAVAIGGTVAWVVAGCGVTKLGGRWILSRLARRGPA